MPSITRFLNDYLYQMYGAALGRGKYSTRQIYDTKRVELLRKVFGKRRVYIDGLWFNFDDFATFNAIYQEIYVSKGYDYFKLPDDARIIDAGANMGMTTMRLKQLYPNAMISCFEPQEMAVYLLKKNLEDNHIEGVTVYPYALSDHDGTAEFNYNPNARASSHAGALRFKDSTTRVVPCVRLSPYIEDHVDLLKVDVEGFEGAIFHELVAAGKMGVADKIVVEYHTLGLLNEIVDILRAQKYTLNFNQSPDEVNGVIYAWK